MKTLIIAEAGVNHNGDMDLARKLIDVAADAGADLVKFQTFDADKIVTPTAQKAEYQIRATDGIETQHEMLKRLQLTKGMHQFLLHHCQLANIGFFSTGFDVDSIQYLVELGLERFKVPSGEITNLPYLRQVGRYGKPVILSTGMATLGEIENALNALLQSGTSLDQITVLHCSSEYPVPIINVNLRAMTTIREAFGVAVGYSDHTTGFEISIAAVALGATVIEKHLTLDRDLPGPDHMASLEPAEFKAMVAAIRNVECALGDGRKRPTTNEIKNKQIIRKSLVAATQIHTGEIFTIHNLTTKRPGTGISPMYWDEILGKKASRNFNVNELIEL